MIKNFQKKIYIALVALVTVFSSCTKELDLMPESAVSPDQITASNIRFFLNGLYLKSIPERDNYLLNDMRGGNYTWTALSGSNSNYGILSTGIGLDDKNGLSSSIWSTSYEGIYNANIIFEAAEKLENTAAINQVKAETSFLRAYLYYNLVTTFGDVPLVTTNTTENIARSPKADVWALIISDLDYAIANGRNKAVTGPKAASIEAAKALKARVLLALNDKTGAAALAKEVIDGAGIDIADDYGSLFRTNNLSEAVFAFENLKTEKNLRFSSLLFPYGTEWAGSYFVQPSDYVLTDLYSNEDLRKDVNIQKITNADETFNMIISKYWDVQPINITRISEMYLICAEGLGQTNGLAYLNDLRVKRGLTALTAADFANDEAYLNEVLEERRRELFSEGFLFFDLVRTDKAKDLPNILTTNRYVMPIPGAQVNLSQGVLVQNESY